ncbi:MAG: hypothetical protein IE928_08280 [Gammaproteobacteria bacterium]|nr:hypothetical protein [Gammaproteobacteria bacterium]
MAKFWGGLAKVSNKMRALHEMVARIKMVKNRLIFVKKLANSQLLAAFFAAISQFFPHFSFSALQPSSSFRAPLVQSSQNTAIKEFL